MSIFGFNTEPSTGGDFLPIAKYDARSGRFTRMDRIDNGNGFESEAIDITQNFKALFDFEHLEVGHILFLAGSAPDFVLVPMGTELPAKPGPGHKPGVRMMIKLSKDCAGDKPAVRELAGTSKAFLSGIEAAYLAYSADKAANSGKLPVMVLEKTTLIKTGSGEKSSTNYQPAFKIVGWAPRGDLTFVPKATAPKATAQSAPPTTGSTRAQPPSQQDGTTDDFG